MKRKMKYNLASIAITLVAFLFGGIATAQPVIQVPPVCNVVVAGSGVGTVLGFGGVVGSGGVVLMSDPFLGGSFMYIPNGTIVTGWSMQGDLSVVTTNPPGSPVQSAGAVGALPIQSFNEHVRGAEGALPSTIDLARSKGRVNVSYFAPGCGGASISFEVYKTYNGTPAGPSPNYIPPIVGPACWQPGKIYTYSVDQIASDNLPDAIGLDNYYWTITDAVGTTVAVTSDYFSADFSSYTFTTPPSFLPYMLPFTIQVCYGRANKWDGNAGALHTTCVTANITSTPNLPLFTPAFPSCLNTTGTPGSFFTSYVPEAGCTYAWTCSNSAWTLTPGPGTLSITTMDDNPGVLTLTVTGPCLPATFTETINRSFDPSVTTIGGSTCVDAGGPPSTYTITSGGPVLNNVTCWTLPPGWTYTPDNGAASQIDITVPFGYTPGAYTVTAFSCSCPGSPINLTVNVRPLPPVSISGPACVDRSGASTYSYSCPLVTGASGYSWILPAGWSCTAGCGSNSETLQPGGTSAGTDNIAVAALGTGGCNSAPSAAYGVNYLPITPSAITVGCFSFGIAGTTTITVGSAPSAFFGTYTVTVAPAGLIPAVGGYSVDAFGVITLNTLAGAAGAYTISITHVTGSCGSSVTVNVPVTVAGNGSSLGFSCNPAPTGVDLFYVVGGPGTASYTWSINGVTVPSYTAAFIALTTGTPAPGPICIYDTYHGCTTVSCQAPCTHGYRLMHETDGTGEIVKGIASQVEVYPNPNPGTFIVKMPATFAGADMQMIDATGKEVGRYKLQAGENNISDNGFAPGIYYLILNSEDNGAVLKIEILK